MAKIKLELDLDDSLIVIFEQKRRDAGETDPLDWNDFVTELLKALPAIGDVVDALLDWHHSGISQDMSGQEASDAKLWDKAQKYINRI